MKDEILYLPLTGVEDNWLDVMEEFGKEKILID